MKQQYNRPQRPDRLARIEAKSDRILTEIAEIRRLLEKSRQDEISTLINRMHRTARRIRRNAERERDLIKRLCGN